ncbi:posphoenolpyruvate synthetase regulatory kinase/phosphorylase PpsR [Amantichitinum ursilacus]|uniref:Putative phosphoenolpyruvate synthase regulatory protein n=1 Tax=Amantichitinum ursilacus TaxID=857265 RepID=A0A0N0XJM4_9NEIS|nr:pyruvate, water dikinase regulatory protein [Amantichitinum ursilacus]KPC53817.1 Phosphoenolpyruvate synthase regulatory protein [Amantichitinum ursilacus]
MPRTAFIVSGRTAITAEMLAHSLITQFEDVTIRRIVLPYIDTPEKAEQAVAQIRAQALTDQCRPLVFSTFINAHLRQLFDIPEALMMDFFESFIGPLEQELQRPSGHTAGKVHGIANFEEYKNRIDAVNFTTAHDDGGMAKNLQDADVILVGVSRSGKTPTCLYLALQYGIKAANYPFTPEDFAQHALPKPLLPFRHKLFGITIEPERLAQIRFSRKPDSHYCKLETCQDEVAQAETLMLAENIPYLNTTRLSIEELSTTIMLKAGLKRRCY